MSRKYIVRNTSGGQVTLVGQRLEDEESFHIEQRNILRWRDDLTVSGSIISGDLTVNDGTADLPTPQKGFEYLLGIRDPLPIVGNNFVTVTSGVDSILLATDNANLTSFVENNSKAIVPAGNVTVTSGTSTITVSGSGAAGLVGTIFTIGFTTPGSAGDKWMSNNSEDPLSNEVNAPIPFNAKLVGITYSSKKSATRGEIEIHRAAFGDAETHAAIFTWNMVSPRRIATKTDISGVTVNAGDKIGIFIAESTPQQPDTPVVMLFFEITDDTEQELTENYGGNFS